MIQARAQSPHGKDFQVSCDKCHTADNWTTMRDTLHFNHDATQFPLEGQHQVIDCRQCHISPEFSKAETNCASCHLDVHEQSVGMECSRCHDPGSWLVNNIQELHRQAAFPLVGAHASANCIDCHKSETGLRFLERRFWMALFAIRSEFAFMHILMAGLAGSNILSFKIIKDVIRRIIFFQIMTLPAINLFMFSKQWKISLLMIKGWLACQYFKRFFRMTCFAILAQTVVMFICVATRAWVERSAGKLLK